MPFEAGLSRVWYRKGKTAGRSSRYSDMYEAWSYASKKASTTPGRRVTQQESFYQGYIDAQERSNPGWIKAKAIRVRRVNGRAVLDILTGGPIPKRGSKVRRQNVRKWGVNLPPSAYGPPLSTYRKSNRVASRRKPAKRRKR